MSGERRDAACGKCDGRRRIVVPCADETCPNQHPHDCSAPCPQCGEKPAPTAAEIAEAREWLDEVTLSILLADGHERTVDHIRTLLAALDATEARAETAETRLEERREVSAAYRSRAETAERERDEANKRAETAEFNYCAHDLIVRHFCQMNASLFARLGLSVAELDEMDPPGVEFALTEAILKLQRERDEANRRATAAEERAESVHAAWSKCLKLLATAERERDEARERGFAAGAEAVRATLKRQCKEAPRG